MRIAVAGGGPGGLLFAKLAKQANQDLEIDVFEQNPANATYGFGVVLADVALDILHGVDPYLKSRIVDHAEAQDRITLVHKGTAIALRGNGFLGIARVKLLELMQANAEKVGVRLHFNHPVRTLSVLDEYDMVVGADGVNSWLRTTLNEHFGASKEPRPNKWVWYGTTKRLDSVGLVFQETPFGTFIAHNYRFAPGLGTFVIECNENAWRKAGLDTATEAQS